MKKKLLKIVLLLIAFKMLFIDKKVKEIATKNENVSSTAGHNTRT